MADRKTLLFTLNGGEKVETDFFGPHSVKEQIAFEEAFGCSYAVIQDANNRMQFAASKAAFTVRCTTCVPPTGAKVSTEDAAEGRRSKHLEEFPDHEVSIEFPEDPDATIDPADMFRVKWIMFFGWLRARPKVASKFSAFLDQLADYSYIAPEPEPEAAAAVANEEPEAPPLEPIEVEPDPADPTTDLLADPGADVPEAGSLDPTDEAQPPTS